MMEQEQLVHQGIIDSRFVIFIEEVFILDVEITGKMLCKQILIDIYSSCREMEIVQ